MLRRRKRPLRLRKRNICWKIQFRPVPLAGTGFLFSAQRFQHGLFFRIDAAGVGDFLDGFVERPIVGKIAGRGRSKQKIVRLRTLLHLAFRKQPCDAHPYVKGVLVTEFGNPSGGVPTGCKHAINISFVDKMR